MAWRTGEILLTQEKSLAQTLRLLDVLSLMQEYASRDQRGLEDFRQAATLLLLLPSRVWILYDDDHMPRGYLWATQRKNDEYQVHQLYAPRQGKRLFSVVKEVLQREGIKKLSGIVDTKARLRLFSHSPYNFRLMGYYVECEV